MSIRIMILKQTIVKHRNSPSSLLTPTENLGGSKAIFTLTANASSRVPKTTLRLDDLLGLPKLSERCLCSWSVYYTKGIEIKIGQRKGCTRKHPGGSVPVASRCPLPQRSWVVLPQKQCVTTQVKHRQPGTSPRKLRWVFAGTWSHRPAWSPVWLILILVSGPLRGLADTT